MFYHSVIHGLLFMNLSHLESADEVQSNPAIGCKVLGSDSVAWRPRVPSILPLVVRDCTGIRLGVPPIL